jgi:lipopolysaccharide transport system permease protein
MVRVWDARWLLWQWIRRDFTVQYRQSLLGLAWAVGQPLLLLLFYGTVFRRVLNVTGTSGNYPVFALCGLVPWTFLASTIIRSVTSLSNAAYIIKQVYFPRSIVPLASAGVTVVDLASATLVLLVVQIASERTIHLSVLGLLPLYLSLALIMSAVAIFCAVIGALIRDVRFVIPVLIQVGFIATPVMYPRSLVPNRYGWVYDLNPVAWIIEAVRGAVILGQWPSLALIGALLLAGIALLAVAIAYSAAVEDRLPDLL